MKSRLFLTLILTALMCLAGWTAHASLQTNTTAKTKWEYTVVGLDENFLTTPKLNQFGDQGWELVGVVAACPTGAANCQHAAYFKRAK